MYKNHSRSFPPAFSVLLLILYRRWGLRSVWLASVFLFLTNSTAFGLAFDFNGSLRWEGGVVPYVIDANVSSTNRELLDRAMRTWEKAANINFVKKTSTDNDYVKIAYTWLNTVNFSWVAKSGGEQPMWINNWHIHTLTHELGHTLGLCHEHQRSDRDKFVTIAGYISVTEINYTKLDGAFRFYDPPNGIFVTGFVGTSDIRSPYDYYSIMHYQRKGFSLPWVEDVIVPKYATVADDPTDNAQKIFYSPDERIIEIIGSDDTNLDDLSFWDKHGIATEYGAPGRLSGDIDGDGTTVPFFGTVPGIKMKLTGTGRTVEAARRQFRNPLVMSNTLFAFEGTPTGTYTVTPSKEGYYFTPRYHTVTPANGSKIKFIISKFETAPPTVVINVPLTSGTSFKNAPAVTGTAVDTGSGVARVRVALFRDRDGVWYDFVGGVWGTEKFGSSTNMGLATGTTSWSRTLPNLADGGYSVHVQGVDTRGNSSDPWEVRNFQIDNVAPKVTVLVPATNNTPYRIVPQAQGVASDENSSIREVRVALFSESLAKWWSWNSNTWGTASFAPANIRLATDLPDWRLNLPNIGVGTYQIHVQSVDAADNGSPWEYSQFSIDQTRPVVAFTGFTNQQHFFNFSQLFGSISETGTVTFRITEYNLDAPNRYWNAFNWVNTNDKMVENPTKFNGLNWSPAAHAPLPTRAQTRTGFYIVDLTATDIAGNVATTNIVLYRTAADATPPIATINILGGREFTNNFLPPIEGLAGDPESGVGTVTMYFTRLVPGVGFEYWTGSAWTDTGTALTMNFTNNFIWKMAGAVAQPSGANLRNGNYTIEVVAWSREVPPVSGPTIVNFSVDNREIFTWTGGSITDTDPNNNNNFWENPANWSPVGVPPESAIAVISSGSPNSRNQQLLRIYGLTMTGGEFATAGLNVKKLNLDGGVLTAAGFNEIEPNGGVFNWSGGILYGQWDVPSSSSLNISGSEKVLQSGSSISSAGTNTWSGAGLLNVGKASIIRNSGTFTVLGDASVYNYTGGGSAVFVNTGTFIKAGGTNTTFLHNNAGMDFNNSGTVSVRSGILSLGSGGIGTNGTYDVAADSRIDWSSGEAFLHGNTVFSGAGTNRIIGGSITFAGGTSTLSGGHNFEVAGGAVAGSSTFAGSGTFRWNGGNISAKLSLQSTIDFNITGRDPKTLEGAAVISSAGQGTWSGLGLLNVGNASIIRNSGTFTVRGDASVYNYTGGGSAVFVNTGTFIKAGGTNTTFLHNNAGMDFNNSGTVSVRSGILSLGSGGIGTNGTYDVAADSRIDWSSGEAFLHGDTIFSGGGINRVIGGSLTLVGGTTTLSRGHNFEVSGGLVAGASSLAGAGTFRWNGGNISAKLSLPSTIDFNLTGSDPKTLEGGGMISSAGQGTWSGTGQLNVGNASVIRNSGTFTVLGDASVYNYTGGGPAVFVNTGTFIKAGGTNTTFLVDNAGMNFDNSGTVSVRSGVLTLGSGGSGTNGTYDVAADSRIDWSSGEVFLHGDTIFSGSGTNRISGGNLTFGGGTSTLSGGHNFEVSGGTVAGTSTFTGAGIYLWNGGNISANLSLPSTIAFNLSGNAARTLEGGGMISSAGQGTWSGTGQLNVGNASVIRNSGTFTVLGDASVFNYTGGGPAVFVNTGTFIKAGGVNTTFLPNNAGMVFTNGGTVDLRSGVLTLGAGYQPSATSQLKLTVGEMAGGSQNSQLNVVGAVVLNGGITVSALNGFQPDSGSLFDIVKYGSRDGEFTNPQLPSGLSWNLNYTATALQLNVTNTLGTPAVRISTPMSGGSYTNLPFASGTASDNSGVREVRVALKRTSDGYWWNFTGSAWDSMIFGVRNSLVATGTTNWSAGLPVITPAAYQVHAQSVDIDGQNSPWLIRDFNIGNSNTTNGSNQTLTLVTDLINWRESTTVISSNSNEQPWPGVSFLPPFATYTEVPVTGAPQLNAVPGATSIASGENVRFYRTTFDLPSFTTLSMEVRASFDNDLHIFINGHELALENSFTLGNFAGPNHWLLVNPDGSIINGYNDGQKFSSTVASIFPSSFFQAGSNEVVLALRNLSSDIGGVAFRADFILSDSTNSTSNCLPPASGLISWWPGEGDAKDIQGANSGVLIGVGSFPTGKVGRAFHFNGQNLVRVEDAPSLRPAHITIEAWVKFDSLTDPNAKEPGLQYILFKKNSRTANFEGYTLLKHRIAGVDRLAFQVTSGSGATAHVDSTSPVVTNQWYHLAGTYEGTVSKLYVNGVEHGAQPGNFPLDEGDRPLFIGGTGESYHEGRFVGQIDEASLFNRALSATEIRSIFEAGTFGKCKPPVLEQTFSTSGPRELPPLPPGVEDQILTAAPPTPSDTPIVVVVTPTKDVSVRKLEINAALGSILRLILPANLNLLADTVKIGAGGELDIAGKVVANVTVQDDGLIHIGGSVVGDVFILKGILANADPFSLQLFQSAIRKKIIGLGVNGSSPDRILETGISFLKMVQVPTPPFPTPLAGAGETNPNLNSRSLDSVAEDANATGLMSITGNYEQTVDGSLFIAIGGTNFVTDGEQQHDRLLVTGRASLEGLIGYDLVDLATTNNANPFQPPSGAQFDIVVASNIFVGNLVVRGPVWGNGMGVTWGVVSLIDGREALRLTATNIPPSMSIQSEGPGVKIVYPANFPGFNLQASPGLQDAWDNISSGTNVIILNATNSARFFRLTKP